MLNPAPVSEVFSHRSSGESLAAGRYSVGKHKGITVKAKACEDYYGKNLDEFFQFIIQSEIVYRLRP